MTQSLRVEQDGRLLHLTLNRAEKRNALNEELCYGIVGTIEHAQQDRHVGAVLLDAEGPVFCAGMDLDEAAADDAPVRTAIHEKLFSMWHWSRKPIIAAVGGPALGGGVGLVANAHITIAAQGVTFGLTEIRLGLWPLLIYRAMVAAIGERRALELSLTGRIFDLNQAVQWGLVHEVAPAFELEDRAMAVAHAVANASAEAVARGMEFAHSVREIDLEAALKLALQIRSELFKSADFREGVAAFREKRAPNWPSHRVS
ncbi:MAG TPA: enoyl-CoA hydratase/isomerase family protein [Bryobacteraceae bacterium]|jgi:enoyl-CoA hydratase/carnithine racemase|nr:enoyl-CoA hydratase/isomerase family protein [Bryobacteraceae bacterium]